MKRILTLIFAFGALLFAFTFLSAEEGGHKEHTSAAKTEHHHAEEGDLDEKIIEGEIIDITCYIRHDSKGPDHLKCAEYCATLGMPFGFLEDKTNKIYLILPDGHKNPIEPYKKFLAKKVKVKGLVYRTGGVEALEIESVEAL